MSRRRPDSIRCHARAGGVERGDIFLLGMALPAVLKKIFAGFIKKTPAQRRLFLLIKAGENRYVANIRDKASKQTPLVR